MRGEPHIPHQPHGTGKLPQAGFKDLPRGAPAVSEGGGAGQMPKSHAIPWVTDCFSLFSTEKAGLMQKTNYLPW